MDTNIICVRLQNAVNESYIMCHISTFNMELDVKKNIDSNVKMLLIYW